MRISFFALGSSFPPARIPRPLNRNRDLRWLARALLLVTVILGSPLCANPAEDSYRRDILPLLQEYCFDCHGDGSDNGGLAFDSYQNLVTLIADRKLWKKVDQFTGSHVMPPVKKAQPSLAERARIRTWIDEHVFYVDPEQQDPGHVTLRRLNRTEYNNAVRDVFQITSQPANHFPADDSGYGFDNIGDVLTISPLLMEKYLRAADQVLDEALELQTLPRVATEGNDRHFIMVGGAPVKEGDSTLLRTAQDAVGLDVELPVRTVYRVAIRAARKKDSDVRLRVALNGKTLFEDRPKQVWKGRRQFWSPIERLLELPAGKHRLSVHLVDPAPGSFAAVDFIHVIGPHTPTALQPSPYLKSLFGERALGVARAAFGGEATEFGEGKNNLDTGSAWFTKNGFRRTQFSTTRDGTYRVWIKAGALQAGEEPVSFQVRIGDRVLHTAKVTAEAQRNQEFTFETKLEAGRHDLQFWFLNEFKDPKTEAERWFWLHQFAIEGPLDAVTPLTQDDIKDALVQTGRRLFRRPLTKSEQRRLRVLTTAVQEAGEPPLGVLRAGLTALLVSPHFLFHKRPLPTGIAINGSQPIDQFTLASRLAAFLWSSLPDERLINLAQRGELRTNLRAEVDRMLTDPKARALTDNFLGQWLQLRDLAHHQPDPVAFPQFDQPLAAAMKRESELLFEHLLQNNHSVLELLTADYSFLNERLAKHYGLGGVRGEEFRKVSLKASQRRGILTHGSILTLTSHPTRTSTVNRGKWILEQLLGTPPPPAPNDVPPLEDAKGDGSLPIRAQLEAHRENATCASCHAFLDPMGFALENFDAIGQWRTVDEGHAVDASAKLVTGQSFKDFSEFQEILSTELTDDFLRSLSENLLTYALGRGVTWRDKLAVREIMRRTAQNDYQIQTLLLAVCESVPFQRTRTPPAHR